MPSRNTNVSQKKDFTPYQQQAFKRFLWLKSNFAYCLIIAVILWAAAICYYIEHFIGWSSILALTPADFGIFVLTLTAPLFAIWFILAYIERSSSLDANAHMFQMYIDSPIAQGCLDKAKFAADSGLSYE